MKTASTEKLTVSWNTPKQIVNNLALIPFKNLPSELSMDRILFFQIVQACSLDRMARYSSGHRQYCHAPLARHLSTPFGHPGEA